MTIIKPHLNIVKEDYKQVLLCNTNRSVNNFLKTIKVRKDGNYKKIPNYLIEKSGKVHHLTQDDVTQHFLTGYHDDNNKVVVVC